MTDKTSDDDQGDVFTITEENLAILKQVLEIYYQWPYQCDTGTASVARHETTRSETDISDSRQISKLAQDYVQIMRRIHAKLLGATSKTRPVCTIHVRKDEQFACPWGSGLDYHLKLAFKTMSILKALRSQSNGRPPAEVQIESILEVQTERMLNEVDQMVKCFGRQKKNETTSRLDFPVNDGHLDTIKQALKIYYNGPYICDTGISSFTRPCIPGPGNNISDSRLMLQVANDYNKTMCNMYHEARRAQNESLQVCGVHVKEDEEFACPSRSGLGYHFELAERTMNFINALQRFQMPPMEGQIIKPPSEEHIKCLFEDMQESIESFRNPYPMSDASTEDSSSENNQETDNDDASAGNHGSDYDVDESNQEADYDHDGDDDDDSYDDLDDYKNNFGLSDPEFAKYCH